jgi:hypothetical protein
MSFIEDRLQDMWNKSRVLSTFLLVHATVGPLDSTQVWLVSSLGCMHWLASP